MKRHVVAGLVLVALFSLPALGDPPAELDYQGKTCLSGYKSNNINWLHGASS